MSLVAVDSVRSVLCALLVFALASSGRSDARTPRGAPRNDGGGADALVASTESSSSAGTPGHAPAVRAHQGRYFRWAMPDGWRFNETTNGVDLYAPDGSAWAGSALLLRMPRPMGPLDFILATPAPGTQNLRLVSSRNLPDQPTGIPGSVWKVAEADATFTMAGKPYRCRYTGAASSGYGQHSYMKSGYCTAPERWNGSQQFLAKLAESIVITNFAQVAGNDQIILPKNHPANTSSVMEPWERRRASQDRIGKGQREATMGTERVKDPQTGRIYEMPLEAYDATVGGYRNPQRPTEILQKTEPGE